MALYNYSRDFKDELVGRAQGHDLNAAYKDLTQVCRAIRGQHPDKAKKILEEAIALKTAIPYSKFNTGMGHRSELGGKKGRYPKKECKMILALLENAVANAEHAGLSKENMFVKHAAAYKQNVFPRHRKYWASGMILGYGKQATWANYATAWAEVIVADRKGVKKADKKAEKKKEEPAKEKPKESKPEPKKEQAPSQQHEHKKTEPKKEHVHEMKQAAKPVAKEHAHKGLAKGV